MRVNEQRSVELVGMVAEVASPTRLVITWANASQAADPASYSRVSFDVVPYEDMVRLTVTHDEFEAGSGMAKGIQQGWPVVLTSLKSLLETGKASTCSPSRRWPPDAAPHRPMRASRVARQLPGKQIQRERIALARKEPIEAILQAPSGGTVRLQSSYGHRSSFLTG